MRRNVAAVAVVAVLASGCGGGGGGSSPTTPGTIPAVPSKVVVLDAGNFEAQVLTPARPSLVDFWTPGCPYCQAMAPVVAQLASDFDGRALVGTVDASTQGALANAYAVYAVPTFVFFKGGREASRIVGATTYAELAGQLQALVASP